MEKTIILPCMLALSATTALAQDIELYTSDGTLSLRGQLIEFVDQQYTIDTSIGKLTFDSDNVLCKGDACPVIKPPVSEFTVVGIGIQPSKLLPELLPSYAQSLSAQVNQEANGTYVFTNAEDEAIAKISLSDAPSSDSAPDLPQGQNAVALTSRPLLPEEALKWKMDPAPESQVEQSTGLLSGSSQVIGLNAITIITAKENPINTISMNDIIKVFSGEYTNWSELGGPDAALKLYGPQSDSELTSAFAAQVLGIADDENSQLSQDIEIVENVAQRVAADANAIGYTYFSNAQQAKALAMQGVCGLVTPPNSFTIKAEEYPLTQRFYAYRVGQTDVEHVDTLMRFMQSHEGQDIVGAYGLVNQHYTSNSISNQGIRLANAITSRSTNVESELLKEMVTQIIDSKRLSTTLRFATGSNQMDQRAQSDIVRLAEQLQSAENEDNNVHLLGFTDSVGDFDLNQEVSLRRANQVRDALLDVDSTLAERVSILPAGFGEIAPIACNETAQGRSINRRVEVWVSKGATPPNQ